MASSRSAPPGTPSRTSLRTVAWGVVVVLLVGGALWTTAHRGTGDSARSRLTVVAPAAPGGGWDLVAREAQQALKAGGVVNNVQVVNIPGAAGTIGLG